MPEVVISDTSCLILLSKIDELELLNKCYIKIRITPEIAEEFGDDLPKWVIVQKAKDNRLQKTLEQTIGKGEASAIALAFETPDCLIITDDLKARKVAQALDFKVTGVLGVIVKAKEKGFIPLVKPLIDKLIKADFRISDNIIIKILEISGETSSK